MRLASCLALWLLAFAPGAAAAPAPAGPGEGPAAPAARPAAPAALQYFVGTWTVTARDPASQEVVTINYQVEPNTGGKWLSGRGESADRSIAARDSWGIDPATGQIVRFIFDSSGAYGVVRAPGWDGDRLVLTGEAHAKSGPTKVRETITRHGPERFDAVWEALVDGAWKPYSIEQARRL